MRNVILLSLSVFAVIIVIAYSITWYMQAWSLESTLEDAIARANAKQPYISYDAIEVSGFPTAMKVALVNPRFKGRVDQLLQGSSAASPLPAWEEEMSLAGRIELGVNIFANQYHFTLSGNPRNTSTIAGESYQLVTEIPSEATCNLGLASSMGIFGTLWDFESLAEHTPEEFLQDFRVLDCNVAGYTVKDQNTNDVYATNGPLRLFISSEEDNSGSDSHQIRFYAKAADSEITSKGDRIVAAYTSALFPESPAQPLYSLYGKSNMEVDFSYIGPFSLEKELGTTPLEIRLNQFNLHNQVYQSNANASFTNGSSGHDRVTTLSVASESNFTEQYDLLLQQMVRGLILQLYSPFVPQPADIQPLIRKYNAAELYNLVQPAIPNMHSLGKLTQSMDFKYQGNAEMTAGDITFTNLNLSSALYGITGRGSIKLSQSQPFPAANILLTCDNCLRLIDDITDYTMRLQRVIGSLSSRPVPSSPFDLNQSDGIKAFMAALAAPSEVANNKTTFTYHITSDGSSGVTVNGKRLEEIMALYSQTIGSSTMLPPDLPAE